jgi:hypothetical protein
LLNDNWTMISYMMHNNPLPIAGFVFIGASGALGMHIQLKMVRAGYPFPYGKYVARGSWGVPLEYLRLRRQHHWSPWPAYFVWPTALIGIACLVTGLFYWR